MQGDRLNRKYTIDLPTPAADGTSSVTRVSCDEWMWLQSDKRRFNRAYIKKYGVEIADDSIRF